MLSGVSRVPCHDTEHKSEYSNVLQHKRASWQENTDSFILVQAEVNKRGRSEFKATCDKHLTIFVTKDVMFVRLQLEMVSLKLHSFWFN
jgi:hypothetical protein